MNPFIIYAMLIVSLRLAGNESPAPTISSLIPKTAIGATNGAGAFFMIPNVEDFVQSMLPRLNIQSVTKYIGKGAYGVIFEVELKPLTATTAASKLPGGPLEAQGFSPAQKSSVIKSQIHGTAIQAGHHLAPDDTAEGPGLVAGGVTESKTVPPRRAVLKIVADTIDAPNSSPEIKPLAARMKSLNGKLRYSVSLAYERLRMKRGIKSEVIVISKIIEGLAQESPLKSKLSDKSSALKDIAEYSEALPDEPKLKEQLTEAERDAAAKIVDVLASLDLDSIKDTEPHSDEERALDDIVESVDYMLLALGEKYVLKKEDEQMIEDIRSHVDSLPFNSCDNYVKQNELSKTVSQVMGYIDIVKSVSEYKPVCFATMELAKADLSEPIEFLKDEYSAVQAGDEMFGEKVKARFSQFSEMLKDFLQGFFDLHLKGGVLHGDVGANNMLLVEDAGKLRIKINDLDLMMPMPTAIKPPNFKKPDGGLEAISVSLSLEASGILTIVKKLLLLNADQIGVHTVDDFELRLDDHESIKEPMTVRQLVLAHFIYLQNRITSQHASQKLPEGNAQRII